MLNKKEIRQKDIGELKTELENTKKELFKVHCRQVTDVVQNHTTIRELKKNIALINTIIREKEISQALKAEKQA
jgi:large subunit ribosomal protein L29